MKNKPFGYLAIALGISFSALMVADYAVFAPEAEAGCRPTGRYVGGLPVLRCTGRTRCRPSGRYKRIGGRRYPILNCPR
jgi:hypothetical protein